MASMKHTAAFTLAAGLAAWSLPAHAQQFNQAIVFGDSNVDAGWWQGALVGLCGNAASPCYPNASPVGAKNLAIAAAIATGTTNGAPVGAGTLMNSQILAAYFGLTANPANQPGGTNYANGVSI